MDTQTNGSSHPEGGMESHGGAQVIPMTLGGHSDGETASFTEAISATASSLHGHVDDTMQGLKSKAEEWEQNAQQQASAMARYNARLQAIEQQMQALEQQAQAAEQRVKGLEPVLTELGDHLTRALEELRGKVENVTTSIGEMNREIASLKESEIPPIQKDVEELKAQPRTGSSKTLKIVVFLIILVGGWSIIGKPGLATITALLPPSILGLF